MKYATKPEMRKRLVCLDYLLFFSNIIIRSFVRCLANPLFISTFVKYSFMLASCGCGRTGPCIRIILSTLPFAQVSHVESSFFPFNCYKRYIRKKYIHTITQNVREKQIRFRVLLKSD